MGIMVREGKACASNNAPMISDGQLLKSCGADQARQPTAKRRASRAGTRCVSTLSSEQLTRKRANDREAQRAIRQRAKDHIIGLEKRIQELTQAEGDTAALVDAQNRNRELERELNELRDKVSQVESPSASYENWPADLESGGCYQSSCMSSVPPLAVITDDAPREQSFKISHQGLGLREEQSFSISLPLHRGWNIHESTTTAAFNLTAAYAPPMTNLIGLDHQSPSLSIWQPSLRSWELPIKYLPPTGIVDRLLHAILEDQRSQTSANIAQITRLLRPPNMRALVYRKQEITCTADPVSNAIAEILHGTQMPSLPEKAACLFVMYKLLCWQISPSLETYDKIPEWFTPRASQLVESHALWVSQIPWPKLRDKVIRNQLQYATDEFQDHYTASLSVNWPYRDVDALMFENDEVRVTPLFENHVTNMENWSLCAPFSTRFPELQEFCKFGNVGCRV